MEQDVQKFLKAEETAEKLVETLRELHAEATSYQAATKELSAVRERLLGLIASTENVVNDSHQVVELLKEIGGPEILDRLTKLENKSIEGFAQQGRSLGKLRILIIVALAVSVITVIIEIVALLG